MAATEPRIPWQRVPQGWIELAAFRDDAVAEGWWQQYLAAAGDAVDDETRAGLTQGFRAGRDVLRAAPFAFTFAGIFPWISETPTVFFIGTTILPSPEDARAARMAGSLSGLVRIGDDVQTESFVALDGRNGWSSTSRYLLPNGDEVGVILADVPLPDASGHVFVVALTPDPEHLDALAPYAALALDSTTLLDPDQEAPAYPGPDILAASVPPGD
ncbi:hypothetical protein NQ160_05825 [Microbacterium sp. zg.Y909]|nr:hypothetical protein [Microbacterium sp. zg.Y909]